MLINSKQLKIACDIYVVPAVIGELLSGTMGWAGMFQTQEIKCKQNIVANI
jgi:hypothetical protein